jgi:hypothetical protein
MRVAEESPHAGCELFALGGAIGDGLVNGAFGNRDAEWDFMASAGWSEAADDAHVMDVARRAAEAMAPYARGVSTNDLCEEEAERVRTARREDNLIADASRSG